MSLGGVTEPAGSMEMAGLACTCLDRNRKRRPDMMKVRQLICVYVCRQVFNAKTEDLYWNVIC